MRSLKIIALPLVHWRNRRTKRLCRMRQSERSVEIHLRFKCLDVRKGICILLLFVIKYKHIAHQLSS